MDPPVDDKLAALLLRFGPLALRNRWFVVSLESLVALGGIEAGRVAN